MLGLRGLAALYVAAFHCRLLTYGSAGPWWLGWLAYGRIAVVFFLVLSGFSLALSPTLASAGVREFARRRALRILPAYWAALAISLAVAAFVVPASHQGPPTGETVVVYGLMLQDLFVAPTPNGAFWSLAVEVELYAVFPLLVFLRRRLGAAALIGLAVAFALLAGTPYEGVNRLFPNLLPAFAGGVLGASARPARAKWWSLLTAAPIAAVLVVHGPAWAAHHYFWLDLAVVPSMVFFLIAVRTGWLRRMLDSAPLRSLGSFSYSLYLIHLPIVMVVGRKLGQSFWITLAVGLPLSVLCAWIFAKVFERPFRSSGQVQSLRQVDRSARMAA